MIEPTANPSVRERIERQVRAAIMDACSMTGRDVQRWSPAGNQAEPDEAGDLPAVWIVVHFAEEEPPQDEAHDSDEWVLPYTIDVHLNKIPDDVGATEYANRWCAALHELMTQDPHRTELDEAGAVDPDGEPLALDTRVAGRFGPTAFAQQRELLCGIEGEIHYRHQHADPWSIG